MDEFFARNRLSAYLDGELPPPEAREVETALDQSPALRAEYEALRGAVEALRVHGPVSAPAGFADRLDARLAGEPLTAGWRRYLRRVRLDVAMLAAAAVVVLVVSSVPQSEEQAAPGVPAPAPAPEAPPEAAPGAAPEAPQAQEAGTTVASDGVLGNEPPPAARRAPTAPTSPRVSKKPGSKQEKQEREAYTPEWEKSSAEPAPAVFAPPSVRYRLRPQTDLGLRELAALAASLGGRLTDANGKPLAAYPMESGDVRVVRIQVPAYNAGAVEAKLHGLGTVETLAAGSDRTLYAAGAEVPITIEVRQP